jgi:uncharacterized RmlC-like cupin family protein
VAENNEITGIAIGLWRFRSSLDPQELCAVAKEWLAGKNGETHMSGIDIRRSSRDEWVMQFAVDLSNGSETTQEKEQKFEKFIYKTSDQLRRRFGNDLLGWDITSSAFYIPLD